MLKNEEVDDLIYFAWRKAQVEIMHTERLGVIHVSDLLKDCTRYVSYNKFEHIDSMDTESLKTLSFGNMVHKATNLSTDKTHNELFFAYDFVKDVPLTMEEAKAIPQDDIRQYDILYGSMDDLYQTPDGGYVIIDKKTTSNTDAKRKYGASEENINQTNYYRVLLYYCYGIDAKQACNLYISSNMSRDVTDKPFPKTYRLRPIENTEKELREKFFLLREYLLSKEMPDRKKNFMCDSMCIYATKCFAEKREKFE